MEKLQCDNRIIKVEVTKERSGRSPLHVWSMFKAALWVSDVGRELTFAVEISRQDYEEIFQIIESHLQDYLTGMGTMTLSSRNDGADKYETAHENGGQTYSFPVFFIKDENGNWRIFHF